MLGTGAIEARFVVATRIPQTKTPPGREPGRRLFVTLGEPRHSEVCLGALARRGCLVAKFTDVKRGSD